MVSLQAPVRGGNTLSSLSHCERRPPSPHLHNSARRPADRHKNRRPAGDNDASRCNNYHSLYISLKFKKTPNNIP